MGRVTPMRAQVGTNVLMKDHTNIRNLLTCPLCGEGKKEGTVVCGGCYKAHELRLDNQEVMDQLKQIEEELANGIH